MILALSPASKCLLNLGNSLTSALLLERMRMHFGNQTKFRQTDLGITPTF
jgi:hypothetical protein